jgi:hypothetical protein
MLELFIMKTKLILIPLALLAVSCGSDPMPQAPATKTGNTETNEAKSQYRYEEKAESNQSGEIAENGSDPTSLSENNYCSQDLINFSNNTYIACQMEYNNLVKPQESCQQLITKLYNKFSSEKCMVQISGGPNERVFSEMTFNLETLNYTFITKASQNYSFTKPSLTEEENKNLTQLELDEQRKERINDFYCTEKMVNEANTVQQKCSAEHQALKTSTQCLALIEAFHNAHEKASCAVALKFQRSDTIFASKVYSKNLLKSAFVREIEQDIIFARPE